MLLDVDDAPYDTATELTCHYKGFYGWRKRPLWC